MTRRGASISDDDSLVACGPCSPAEHAEPLALWGLWTRGHGRAPARSYGVDRRDRFRLLCPPRSFSCRTRAPTATPLSRWHVDLRKARLGGSTSSVSGSTRRIWFRDRDG